MLYTKKQLEEIIENAILNLKFPDQPKELYQPMVYAMSSTAKRVRPVLMLMTCDMLEGDIQEALNPAIGIEIFHNFTLLHDDIMDNAPIRRSRKTVHEKWNKNIAMLSGDALFIYAVQLFKDVRKDILPKVLEVFTENAIIVCEGQQIDMNFEKSDNISINDYLKMIESKTAALLGCCLQIGALIADAADDTSNKLFDFGKNLGIGFQLKDDLLDIYGNQERFGKKSGGDIIADKKTFLLLKAKELADKKTLIELDNLFSKNHIKEDEKIQGVKNIYDHLNIEAITQKEIDKHFDFAVSSLNKVSVNESRKKELKLFVQNLVTREN